jgi:hypothetical protein
MLVAMDLGVVAADLRASVDGETRPERLAHFTKFLEHFGPLVGEARDWGQTRGWLEEQARLLVVSREVLTDWHAHSVALMNEGGEEGAEEALRRRSQYAFLREAFRNTEADEWLAPYDDEAWDLELRAAALAFGFTAPANIPSSHVWWWPSRAAIALKEAAHELWLAVDGELEQRGQRFSRFMELVDTVGTEVGAGRYTWVEGRTWAKTRADLVARAPLRAWRATGDARAWAFLRELFRETDADLVLAQNERSDIR